MSSRMFLWQNPGQNNSLKRILNDRPSVFSEKPFEELAEYIKTTLALDYNIFCNIVFIMDVMMPEVCLHLFIYSFLSH